MLLVMCKYGHKTKDSNKSTLMKKKYFLIVCPHTLVKYIA